jgi:hypothetical protein
MTMIAMLLVGIAIAVLLYIVVQRLDRIITLQLQHQEQHQLRLHQIISLLEREELDRRRAAANQASLEPRKL